METNGKNEIMITETIMHYYAARQRLLWIFTCRTTAYVDLNAFFPVTKAADGIVVLGLSIPLTELGNQVQC